MTPLPRAVARNHAEKTLLFKAVKQSRFGFPMGNCLEACFATLLGVPLSSVPDPRNEARTRREGAALIEDRERALQEWLHRTFTLTAVANAGASPPGVLISRSDVPLFWIASGPSERRLQHAVIYSNTKLLFDPHPSDAGLLSVNRWTVLAPLGPLWDRVVPAETRT